MSMTIVDRTVPSSRRTTINDIKPGTVFRGTIYGNSAERHITGLFFRARTYGNDQPRCVQLDGEYRVWVRCAEVTNYEEVDAVLELRKKF